MSDRDDLVRVDPTGTLVATGTGARQTLRECAGQWRLLPSAEGTLLFRRAEGPEKQAVLRIAGEIKTPGALCEVVSVVTQAGWKGELVVIEGTKVRSLFFETGSVVGAHTNVPAERLGETLYRFGVVTREELDRAVNAATENGKRVGESAVDLAFVSPEKLYPMMARQVEEVFYASLHVGDGMFYFFDRFDEEDLGRRHALNAGMLLMEGVRRMDEMSFFRQRVPSGEYVVTLREVGKKPPEELARVLAECDGKRNVAEIGRRLGYLEFEVTRAIFLLASGGFVSVSAARPQGPQVIIEQFNLALAQIHAQCDAVGKGAELRSGLARFATGGGVYDPLFERAGPRANGTFVAILVEENLKALTGEDPDAWLIQLMQDYIGFALFHSGSLLPRSVESKLVKAVEVLLKVFRPVDGPPSRR